MRHMYFADSVAEAEAIAHHLWYWCGNDSVVRSHLFVSWVDDELTEWDWQVIWENNEDALRKAGHKREEYIV